MAELHESLLRSFRKKHLKSGFRETRSPMPTFKPDVFAQKISKGGKIIEELIVEAEIESTLFTEHTSHQLILMNEYISHQHKRGTKIRAYLLVPFGKNIFSLARSLLASLFPLGTKIKIIQK